MNFLFRRLFDILPPRIGMALWRRLRKAGLLRLMDDATFYICATRAHSGERFALPKDGGGINSLINWQRLCWKSDLPVVCSDKIRVRDYVRARVGDDCLIPMLPAEGASWDDPDQIDFGRLPDCFVLKLNNGYHMNLVVRGKDNLDIDAVRRTLRTWLASDDGARCRERQYCAIRNRVYCEKFIGSADGRPPPDYKFMCSDGKPLFLWVDVDRGPDHRRAVFDPDFNRLPVTIRVPPPDFEIERPGNFARMVEIASRLSRGIPLVRIDLYSVDDHVYFGEMTFTSGAAKLKFSPFSFSQAMAAHVDLRPFLEPKEGVKA